VINGSQWEVIDLTKQQLSVFGLAANNQELAKLVGDLPVAVGSVALQAASKLIGFLHVFVGKVVDEGGRYTAADGTVRMVQGSGSDAERYPHEFVLLGAGTPLGKQALIVETRSELTRPAWIYHVRVLAHRSDVLP
jgi:hypothetical protein